MGQLTLHNSQLHCIRFKRSQRNWYRDLQALQVQQAGSQLSCCRLCKGTTGAQAEHLYYVLELTLHVSTSAPQQVLHEGSQPSCGIARPGLQHCMFVEL